MDCVLQPAAYSGPSLGRDRSVWAQGTPWLSGPDVVDRQGWRHSRVKIQEPGFRISRGFARTLPHSVQRGREALVELAPMLDTSQGSG